MLSLARNGYTAEAVAAALHGSPRRLGFRYALYDKAGGLRGGLARVRAAAVAYSATADIRRTCKLTIEEGDDLVVNYLSDRLKPYARLQMPDGGWAEFPLGLFVLSTPPRVDQPGGQVTREVEAYDLLQVLSDDKYSARFTAAQGANYIATVQSILGGAGLGAQNVTPSSLALPAALDWEPGTSKLTVVNALLTAANYAGLWVDADGVAQVQPYVLPAARGAAYSYAADALSVLDPGLSQQLDLFGVPNQITAIVSEADRDPLVSSYTNDNPASPTSTASRGRVIARIDSSGVQAADQATLDAYVQRLAFEASQVYEELEFTTAIMPFHADQDVLRLAYPALGIDGLYVETGWSFTLAAGARMQHTARKVVSV